jgi:hypothetical protein
VRLVVSTESKVVRKLNAEEYERMCREVRDEFGLHVMPEALLYALCKRVYHHAHGYGQDLKLPYSHEPRQEVYMAALRRLVVTTQNEPFDELEIARRYLGGI